MSPDDLPDPPNPAPRVPDPASTNLGVPRRGERLDYPSLAGALSDPAPPPTPPPAAPRKWDSDEGRWVDTHPSAPSDPGLAEVDSAVPPAELPSFDFPDHMSDLPVETDERDGANPPAGWLDRLARWLGRR